MKISFSKLFWNFSILVGSSFPILKQKPKKIQRNELPTSDVPEVMASFNTLCPDEPVGQDRKKSNMMGLYELLLISREGNIAQPNMLININKPNSMLLILPLKEKGSLNNFVHCK